MSRKNQTVSRVFCLLHYLSQGKQSNNLSQIERELGINRITLSRLLKSLVAEGVLEPIASGGYQLSINFLALAANSLNAKDFDDYYQNRLESLCQQFSLSAYYTLLEGNNVFYLARKTPLTPLISNIKPGARVPFFTVAPGMILWAHQPTKTRELMLQQAERDWPNHHQQLQNLTANFTTLIHDKVAWSFSGYDGGVNACAAAILTPNKQCVAAISLVGPEQNFLKEAAFRKKLAQHLLLACEQLGIIYSKLN